MRRRNLADPAYEPSDEELGELLAAAAADARQRHARATALLAERIRDERARLGLPPGSPPSA